MLSRESAFVLCNIISVIGWMFCFAYWFQKNRFRGKREIFYINENLIEVGVVFLVVGHLYEFALTLSFLIDNLPGI